MLFMFGPLKKLPRLLQWDGRAPLRTGRAAIASTRQSANPASARHRLVDDAGGHRVCDLVGRGSGCRSIALAKSIPTTLRARVDFTVVNHISLVNQERQRAEQGVQEKAVHSDGPCSKSIRAACCWCPTASRFRNANSTCSRKSIKPISTPGARPITGCAASRCS